MKYEGEMVGRRKSIGDSKTSDFRGPVREKEGLRCTSLTGRKKALLTHVASTPSFPPGRRNYQETESGFGHFVAKINYILTLTFHLLGDGFVRFKPVLGREKKRLWVKLFI
jgi:hypothetical protein